MCVHGSAQKIGEARFLIRVRSPQGLLRLQTQPEGCLPTGDSLASGLSQGCGFKDVEAHDVGVPDREYEGEEVELNDGVQGSARSWNRARRSPLLAWPR